MIGLELRIIFLKWTFFWFFFGLSILDFFFFVGSLSRLRNLLSPLCWSLVGSFFCSNLVESLIVRSLAKLRTLLGFFFYGVLLDIFFVKTLLGFSSNRALLGSEPYWTLFFCQNLAKFLIIKSLARLRTLLGSNLLESCWTLSLSKCYCVFNRWELCWTQKLVVSFFL